ncbi:unnamed protein product [Diatraea saccharalis]|uniref:Uncharacterized protein n=1 Tax=Diatraea saccharalis TaxID=40085 RepID=A0A9N9WJR4_9NEOP|nr:unnamed protein product [Diatraea saccharalis]
MGLDFPRWPSTHWRVFTTADAAGINGLTCLPKYGGVRDKKIFGYPSYDRPLENLLNNRISDRALATGPSSCSCFMSQSLVEVCISKTIILSYCFYIFSPDFKPKCINYRVKNQF